MPKTAFRNQLDLMLQSSGVTRNDHLNLLLKALVDEVERLMAEVEELKAKK